METTDESRIFIALSNPKRLQMVEFLLDSEEATQSQLRELVGEYSATATTRAVAILRDAGLLWVNSRTVNGVYRNYVYIPEDRKQEIRDAIAAIRKLGSDN